MVMALLSASTSGLSSKAMGCGGGGGMPIWSGCEWVKVGRSLAKTGMLELVLLSLFESGGVGECDDDADADGEKVVCWC